VIPWGGEEMHDPDRSAGCWADGRSGDGTECGGPVVLHGLCGDCLVRLGGERPVMPIPAPPSAAFLTGCGRR